MWTNVPKDRERVTPVATASTRRAVTSAAVRPTTPTALSVKPLPPPPPPPLISHDKFNHKINMINPLLIE